MMTCLLGCEQSDDRRMSTALAPLALRSGWYPSDPSMGPDEVGQPPAHFYSVNVAWPASGVHDGDAMAALLHVALPMAHEFQPDLVIVAAGFQAADGEMGEWCGACCRTSGRSCQVNRWQVHHLAVQSIVFAK